MIFCKNLGDGYSNILQIPRNCFAFLSFLSLAIINLTFMDVQRFHFSKFLNEKRNVIENESFKVFHVKNNSTVQVYIPYKMMIEKRLMLAVPNLLGTDSFHQVAQSLGNYIALIATR